MPNVCVGGRCDGDGGFGCGAAPESFAVPEGTLLTYNAKLNRLYVHLLEYPLKHLPVAFADKIKYAQFLHDASEIRIEQPRTVGGTIRTDVSASLVLPVIRPKQEIPVIELMLR